MSLRGFVEEKIELSNIEYIELMLIYLILLKRNQHIFYNQIMRISQLYIIVKMVWKFIYILIQINQLFLDNLSSENLINNWVLQDISDIDEDSYNNYLEYAEQMSEVYLEKNIDPIEVLSPEYSMDIGYISSFYDLANIYTVMQEDENLKYTTYSVSNKFLGKDIISIISKSNKKEIAKDFISYVIDKKSQEINNYKGIPINKETLLSIYNKNVGNDNLGGIGISGEEYLMDEISLDEALDKINIDLEIYLMEQIKLKSINNIINILKNG